MYSLNTPKRCSRVSSEWAAAASACRWPCNRQTSARSMNGYRGCSWWRYVSIIRRPSASDGGALAELVMSASREIGGRDDKVGVLLGDGDESMSSSRAVATAAAVANALFQIVACTISPRFKAIDSPDEGPTNAGASRLPSGIMVTISLMALCGGEPVDDGVAVREPSGTEMDCLRLSAARSASRASTLSSSARVYLADGPWLATAFLSQTAPATWQLLHTGHCSSHFCFCVLQRVHAVRPLLRGLLLLLLPLEMELRCADSVHVACRFSCIDLFKGVRLSIRTCAVHNRRTCDL